MAVAGEAIVARDFQEAVAGGRFDEIASICDEHELLVTAPIL